MTKKISILVICVHNSGRSQIAAAYLNKFGGGRIQAESAGFEPAREVNPIVVEVMREEGLETGHIKPQSVFALFKEGRLFDHVITVCDDSDGKCPIFPGLTHRWHWPFPDPAAAKGTHEEKKTVVRKIRDMIRERLLQPVDGDFNFKKYLDS